eukprot:XP_016655890.1 PREDICTED: uncharacterized protein LOC107882271 [Acyrthosiphon pisum]
MAEKGYSFAPKVCDEKWRRLSTQHQLLNESSQPSYSEPCSSNSTSTTMTSNIILNPPLLTIPTPSQSTISPTLTPNYTCSTFKAKTPSWFEKYENMKKDQISTQSIELNKRLDKLEKREHEMLEVQKQLVDKLNTANDIEIQKLDMFKKMFKID